MLRKWTLLLTTLTCLAPASVFALGLGEITVHSGLNQSLNAEIELLSARPEEVDNITVTLAGAEAFAAAGVDRPFLLTLLRFKVEQRANGTPYIKVYTQEPIKEPYLDYLIEVNWPAGRLLRQYTVLLDPPNLMAAQQPVIRAPQARSEPVPVPDSTDTASNDAETTTSATAGPAVSGDPAYVRSGEGLWSVAKRLLPDGSVTMEQMMLALLKANPEAFLNNNVNNLKAGYTLRVPESSEITALTPEEAKRLVKQQYAEWKNTSRAQVASQDPAPEQPAPPASAVATDAKLKLVAAPADGKHSDAPTSGAGGAGGDIKKVSEELTLANEELDAKRQENAELQSRLADLEKQMADMQRLITLKNEELAALQAKLNAPAPGNPAEFAAPAAPQPAAPPSDTPQTQAPKSAETALPMPTLESSLPDDLLAALRDNPMMQGLAALVAILLLALLWIANRRRRMNARVIEAAETMTVMPSAVVETAAATVDAAPAVTDPLAAADAYLADERYAQAEDVLREALAQDAQRHDIRMKLLEMYYLTRDKNAFVMEAEALHAVLDGEDGALWDKVISMGKELCPDDPLFSPPAESFVPSDTPTLEIPAEQPPIASAQQENTLEWPSADQESVTTAVAESGLANFSLADIQQELEDGLAQQSAAASAPPAENALTLELEPVTPQASNDALDMPGLEFQMPDSIAPRQAPETPEQSLDFDLSQEASLLAETHTTSEQDDMSLDLDALTNTDEVGTKLDLARAYIEMGDPEGAQSILDEVLKEGSDAQKREAQELLLQVS
ncbi:MAG: FimV/HubP family polar landmark protein [Pseudomonadota bacterium]